MGELLEVSDESEVLLMLFAGLGHELFDQSGGVRGKGEGCGRRGC